MIQNILSSFSTSQYPSSITHIQNQHANATISLDTDESLHLIVVEGNSDITLNIITSQPKATTTVKCLCLATTDTYIKITVNGQVSHDHTAIDLHVVTLYGEKGSAQIDGKVALMPGGVSMHGELLEENIILGKQASIKTLPMLDVHTSEVTAGHGARIERLDSKKLFYLKSRGLDEQQATHMMIGGYIESIFDGTQKTPEVESLKAHAFATILASL